MCRRSVARRCSMPSAFTCASTMSVASSADERREPMRRVMAVRRHGSGQRASFARLRIASAKRIAARDGAELVARDRVADLERGVKNPGRGRVGKHRHAVFCSDFPDPGGHLVDALGHADRDPGRSLASTSTRPRNGWGSRRPRRPLGTSVIIRFVAMRCPRWRRSCLSGGISLRALGFVLEFLVAHAVAVQQLSATPTPSRWPRSAG